MRPRALWLALAVLAAMPAMGAAKPRGPTQDRVWLHPDIERLRPARIAILPGASFVNISPKEQNYLEDVWMEGMKKSRHVWMPAVLCRERMAATSRRGDSLLNAVGNQVRSRGRVDSTSAPRLARLLQSDALFCLRIDRWERVTGSYGTPHVVHVDMTATLVDSTGRLLWRASSEERLESVHGIPKVARAELPAGHASNEEFVRWRASNEGGARHVLGRPGEMGMTTQSSLAVAADFRAAVTSVMARWAARFPESSRRPAARVAR